MTTEQQFAHKGRPTSEGEVKFEQIVKGWGGSGFDSSYRIDRKSVV